VIAELEESLTVIGRMLHVWLCRLRIRSLSVLSRGL
jgi:hypothetical protein